MKIQISYLLSAILLCTILFPSTGSSDNRVHSAGNVRMNITDYGYIGNLHPGVEGAMSDPENPDELAPPCEFPAGSGVNYLGHGGLWIGAIVRMEEYEFPRVSVALAINRYGTTYSREMFADPESEIIERSNIEGATDYQDREIYSPNAVATQEFLCEFADTLTDGDIVEEDPVDGEHQPLGLKISQKSMVWEDQDIEDIIIIEWEVENISDQYLKNLYLGLYIDGHVGDPAERQQFEDDMYGLSEWRYFQEVDGELDSVRINLSYIVDNDGRPMGEEAPSPTGVTGVMVLDSPNPELNTSVNWWVANGDVDLDFGPSWQDDNAADNWTINYGSPMGDVRKYFLMSNRELDYDMAYCNDPDYLRSHRQIFRDRWNPDRVLESHDWKIPGQDDNTPENWLDDLANGGIAIYMQSWGPLGVFDHIDESGNRIYRLNPGEIFSMTVAYVCAENYHDPDQDQPNLTDLWANAAAAQGAFQQYLSVDIRPPVLQPGFIMLSPNYPNPFNSSTIVTYTAIIIGSVNLSLIDNSGRMVRSWAEPVFQPGEMNIAIDASGLATGNYYLRATQNGHVNSTKLVLLK